MYIFRKFTFIFIFICITANAQETGPIKELVSFYKSFEFEEIIRQTDSLLAQREKFDNPTLLEILEFRSASLFALGDQVGARKSFIDLLKIDQNYELSESEYSPKLISLFIDVKSEYVSIIESDEMIKNSESENPISESASVNYNNYNSAIAKSLLIPGWGHFEMEENSKGIVLTSLGLASLGSMVYYIFDTESKERDYLNEINSDLIKSRYDDYNSSYRIRNALIISYAAIWLYTQIDLLLFDKPAKNRQVVIMLHSNKLEKYNSTIFSVQFNF